MSIKTRVKKPRSVHRVVVVESDRVMGRKVDEIKTFASESAAESFVKTYNSINTSPTAPDWYMVACLEKNYIG